MKYKFFNIPVLASEAAAEDLNRFLNGHRVLAVDRHLIANGANSVWAICVSYDEPRAGARLPPAVSKGEKVDYRDILSDPEFAVFSRLRALRKTRADLDGVLPYAVFSNDQLAQMVQHRIVAPSRLRDIPGIGEARVEKYGEAFLAIVRDAALPPPVVAPAQTAHAT